METILKFFSNAQSLEQGETQRNSVISRTMLKIAVVSKYVLDMYASQPDRLPKNGELWRCRLSKESQQGKNTGCFIVEPIVKVEENDIVKLVPGTYTTTLVDKKLVVSIHPEYRGKNWMMPLQHKRLLTDQYGAYCIIVDLDSSEVVISEPKDCQQLRVYV